MVSEIGQKGTVMVSEIRQFLRDHGISEVEAIIPDMAGIARGKIMPAQKFAEDSGMRLPESVFLQTVTGDYPPETGEAMSPGKRRLAYSVVAASASASGSKGPSAGSTRGPGRCSPTFTPGAPPEDGTSYQAKPRSVHSMNVGQESTSSARG